MMAIYSWRKWRPLHNCFASYVYVQAGSQPVGHKSALCRRLKLTLWAIKFWRPTLGGDFPAFVRKLFDGVFEGVFTYSEL